MPGTHSPSDERLESARKRFEEKQKKLREKSAEDVLSSFSGHQSIHQPQPYISPPPQTKHQLTPEDLFGPSSVPEPFYVSSNTGVRDSESPYEPIVENAAPTTALFDVDSEAPLATQDVQDSFFASSGYPKAELTNDTDNNATSANPELDRTKRMLRPENIFDFSSENLHEIPLNDTEDLNELPQDELVIPASLLKPESTINSDNKEPQTESSLFTDVTATQQADPFWGNSEDDFWSSTNNKSLKGHEVHDSANDSAHMTEKVEPGEAVATKEAQTTQEHKEQETEEPLEEYVRQSTFDDSFFASEPEQVAEPEQYEIADEPANNTGVWPTDNDATTKEHDDFLKLINDRPQKSNSSPDEKTDTIDIKSQSTMRNEPISEVSIDSGIPDEYEQSTEQFGLHEVESTTADTPQKDSNVSHSQLEKDLAEARAELERRLDAFKEERTALEHTIKDQSSTIEQLKSRGQHMDSQESNAAIQHKALLDEQKMIIDEQKATIGEQKASLDEQNLSIEHKEVIIKEQKATIDEQKATIDEQKVTIDEQKATIDEQKATIDEQKATIDEQKATIDEQKAIIQQQTSEIEEKRITITTQESSIEEQRLMIESLKNENSKLKLGRMDLNLRIADLEEELADLKTLNKTSIGGNQIEENIVESTSQVEDAESKNSAASDAFLGEEDSSQELTGIEDLKQEEASKSPVPQENEADVTRSIKVDEEKEKTEEQGNDITSELNDNALIGSVQDEIKPSIAESEMKGSELADEVSNVQPFGNNASHSPGDHSEVDSTSKGDDANPSTDSQFGRNDGIEVRDQVELKDNGTREGSEQNLISEDVVVEEAAVEQQKNQGTLDLSQGNTDANAEQAINESPLEEHVLEKKPPSEEQAPEKESLSEEEVFEKQSIPEEESSGHKSAELLDVAELGDPLDEFESMLQSAGVGTSQSKPISALQSKTTRALSPSQLFGETAKPLEKGNSYASPSQQVLSRIDSTSDFRERLMVWKGWQVDMINWDHSKNPKFVL
ncbi:putative venom protein [Clavispora lusitaniae]|uniref:Uncharacterized protein n=2 Tax=Clavispora lusitaniae TaxID=36911 RepID=C4XW01_CLAL4|nr:uncharacterized protein CLUG_00124 [Clavispora lusitaniae ATCC 42720]QFZ25057.1 putative venom protein [Clavispora lusitaniae]EEQ36001.1 hypothetical protein CLUG_00124 [Clavispora lusitaniae ATCC 42720]QFZ31640.1 putative venom protein [Clavispora lusitaniae]QFZ37308.1 putative venom protein [Clavispora lusitaniae]QFZ42992.1 putative venom protein [Clavispora lusitaniae]